MQSSKKHLIVTMNTATSANKQAEIQSEISKTLKVCWARPVLYKERKKHLKSMEAQASLQRIVISKVSNKKHKEQEAPVQCMYVGHALI